LDNRRSCGGYWQPNHEDISAMRILKIVSGVVLLLFAVCSVVAWQFASGHFPERGAAYEARMVYLPIPESEKANTADAVWPWPFSRFYNPFLEAGPYLLSYPILAEPPTAAVLILPGGGYFFRSEQYEGMEIAEWLNAQGIAAFVLNYRLKQYPAPLDDTQMALRYLRHNADRFNLDPGRLGIMGFSAGGHLAALASTLYDEGAAGAVDPLRQQSSRPDFSILAYAIVSFSDPLHAGVRSNLVGDAPEPAFIELLSAEQQVTSATPPAFIWTAKTDPIVPFENSVAYGQALLAAGVPVEVRIYPEGRHGSALAQNEVYASVWPKQLLSWLDNLGFHALN
jgi:acetyl esterase/lipase